MTIQINCARWVRSGVSGLGTALGLTILNSVTPIATPTFAQSFLQSSLVQLSPVQLSPIGLAAAQAQSPPDATELRIPNPTPQPQVSPEAPASPAPQVSPTAPAPQVSPTSPAPDAPAPAAPSDQTQVLLEESGTLDEQAQVLPSDGSRYREHTFEGTAGQSVTISLESSDFDTYLVIVDPENRVLGENDDASPNDTNSQLTVTLPSTGTYRVIANAYDRTGQGSYNLTVR